MGVDLTIRCKHSLIPGQNIAKKSKICVTPLKKLLTTHKSVLKDQQAEIYDDVDVKWIGIDVQMK